MRNCGEEDSLQAPFLYGNAIHTVTSFVYQLAGKQDARPSQQEQDVQALDQSEALQANRKRWNGG